MKRVAMIVALVSLCSYLAVEAVEAPEPEAPATELFPIATRFDIPRDYGYFIGDEIPLTLVIETSQGTVLDLVNLPRQGEQHGLFEIRSFTLASNALPAGGTAYHATYTLQYFGAAPLTIQFEPLEILYAQAEGNPSSSRVSSYRSLFTQPVTLNISRIGPYQPTKALEPKGPLPDTRADLVWLPCLLGTTFLLLAIAGWGQDWRRRQRQQRESAEPPQTTAVEKALQTLRQPRGALAPCHAETPAADPGHIIREYLQSEWQVPAFTLTSGELAAHLPTGAGALIELLHKCDTLKYQATPAEQTEERFVWEETLTLFEQLDKGSMS